MLSFENLKKNCFSNRNFRFLFPIYPLISLHAAIGISSIQKMWVSINSKVKINNYLDQTKHVMYVFVTVFIIMGKFNDYERYISPFYLRSSRY